MARVVGAVSCVPCPAGKGDARRGAGAPCARKVRMGRVPELERNRNAGDKSAAPRAPPLSGRFRVLCVGWDQLPQYVCITSPRLCPTPLFRMARLFVALLVTEMSSVEALSQKFSLSLITTKRPVRKRRPNTQRTSLCATKFVVASLLLPTAATSFLSGYF